MQETVYVRLTIDQIIPGFDIGLRRLTGVFALMTVVQRVNIGVVELHDICSKRCTHVNPKT